MKNLIFLMTTLLGLAVNAQSGSAPLDVKIYCYESAILPDAKETYFVEVQSQADQEGSHIKSGRVSTADSSLVTIDLDVVAKKTKGSMTDGEVIYFLSEFPKDGYLNYLSILYPWGLTRSQRLPAVYVGVKEGKHFSVALTCTHMKASKVTDLF